MLETVFLLPRRRPPQSNVCRTRVCEIDNCKDNHNRLVHVSKEQTQADQRQPVETGPTTDERSSSRHIEH